MMKANDLSELEIVDGQTRIVLKRGAGQNPPQIITMTPAVAASEVNSTPPEVPPAAPASENTSSAKPVEEENMTSIVAPLVGTYYSAPSPNAAPFVEVGAKVGEETIVCIIEAMKVMNEIKSGISGTIKKILVEKGSAVEYGQPLFLVEQE